MYGGVHVVRPLGVLRIVAVLNPIHHGFGIPQEAEAQGPVSRSVKLLLKAPIRTAGPSRKSSNLEDIWKRMRYGWLWDTSSEVTRAKAVASAKATFSEFCRSIVFTGGVSVA